MFKPFMAKIHLGEACNMQIQTMKTPQMRSDISTMEILQYHLILKQQLKDKAVQAATVFTAA